MTTIHYRTDDGIGEIVGFTTGAEDTNDFGPGIAKAVLSNQVEIVLRRDRYDANSGCVLQMNEEQAATVKMPTRTEVESRIAMEIAGTDLLTVMDAHPAVQKARESSAYPNAEWVLYQHALRRLSDYETAADMLINWPERPDGADPIMDLRNRLSAARGG